MTKAIRLLTMAGMGLMASVAIGAGPAQATDSGAQSAVKSAAGQATQVEQDRWRHRDRDRVVGYYRSLRACEFAGRIGERFDRWEDYDCDYVRFGFRRGAWALEVEQDRNWHRPGHGNGGNGHWGNGPRDHHRGR
jgi:hypothetical protein